jgi:Family of unknown function (DUF6600)/FecR protein
MRNNAARWLTLFTAMLALSFLANPRIAAAADDDDPPARAARLSFAGGAVSFEPAGTDEWVDAVVNRPMTTGDKLWTDRDGRAEVRIDSYGLRLGPQTGFSFLNLDDNTVQVRLTEGSLNIRVRRLEDNETLEIDTPNLAFNVLRSGSYRIDVNENGDTTVVSVREGQGEVTGGGSAYPVHAGDSVTFSGTDQLSVDVQDYQGNDDFDRWSSDRDRRWDRSTAPKYVSDDVVGYEDLDEYGGWRPVPEYGTVWFPRTTVAGWAPYRYGHWVWVSPWGWTWVDDAPWGFAPFHYGRWVTVGGVWGWVPSPPRPAVVTVAYVRPVYAPALVAWVGGSHFGVGVAVGGAPSGVAWFPLGPRDVYCPSYHVSPRYVERVNVSNTVIVNRTQVTNVYNNVYVNKTTNVTNITYQNQRANNAVTATSQASFTSAQPVGRNMVRVNEREVASAPVAPMTNVAPQQRSFSGATGPARARPPANAVTRAVVAKSTPPPPPATAAKQVQAVQANGGRPPAVSRIRDAQPEAARSNVRIAAAAKPAPLPARGNQPAPSTNQPGARPNANQPPAQPNANQPAPNQPSARPNPNQPAERPNANRPPSANNPNQPNANRANPSQPTPNQPAPDQPAARPNPNQPPERPNSNRTEERPNPNRPPSANNPNQPNVNRANPSQPTPNQPAPDQPAARPNPNQPPERPNSNRPEERPNPNRPPSANNPNQPNVNRASPSQPTPNQPAPNQPAARPNPNQPPERPNSNRPEERANPNRPPAANTPSEPNPNANRPANRPSNERPSAAPPAVDRQAEQQQLEKQRQQQQQQRMEQQRANEQRQQQIQRQQQPPPQQKPQQNDRKEVQKQQPPPKQQQENAKPQPPKKENNKENKDRPPSR